MGNGNINSFKKITSFCMVYASAFEWCYAERMFYVKSDRNTSSHLIDRTSFRHMSLHIVIAHVSYSQKPMQQSQNGMVASTRTQNSKPRIHNKQQSNMYICNLHFQSRQIICGLPLYIAHVHSQMKLYFISFHFMKPKNLGL